MKRIVYFTLFSLIIQILPAQQTVYAQSKSVKMPPGEVEKVEKELEKFRANPEPDTGRIDSETESAKDYMIVTANPLATQAGNDILASGGTAADAAYASQLVLGLVEPQSSGLGGGGFALYWDAGKQELQSFDARETAPMAVSEDLFLDENSEPMSVEQATIGGRAVGVPGIPKLLDTLYQRYGQTERSRLFGPAQELAEYGFIVSPRLAKLIADYEDSFRFFHSAKDYFTPKEEPLAENANVQNTKYLRTLRLFENEGSETFYSGEVGRRLLKTVNEAWHNPGEMSTRDLADYQVKMREPVCGHYRMYKICSMGEPSSGGLTLIQMLDMVERFDLHRLQREDPLAWHLIAESSRLAFADRNMYMADPDFVKTPGTALINPAYTAVRSSLIEADTVQDEVKAGLPLGWEQEQSVDKSEEQPGTSHIVAVDKYGNAISFTTSIESAFGAKIMSSGFLLNNQLTDFSFVPEEDDRKIANRVQPGKRPRSSMTPVIVFNEEDQPVMLIGSAGGSRIIGYVLQRLIAVLDWQMDVDDALAMPNIVIRGDTVEIEEVEDQTLVDADKLKEMGHNIEVAPMNSGMTALVYRNGAWHGAADPRREGVPMGE